MAGRTRRKKGRKELERNKMGGGNTNVCKIVKEIFHFPGKSFKFA